MRSNCAGLLTPHCCRLLASVRLECKARGVVSVPNCIFCDQPFGAARARSGEHAVPQWCRDLVPDLGPAIHGHTLITPEGRRDRDLGSRDPFTTICRDVCEACNTGWMHELEESARPVLQRLIQGQGRKQSYWRQTLGATWAVKTAMVWDSVMPAHRIVPREARRSFHQTQRLTRREQVWIGQYDGVQPHSYRETGATADGIPVANVGEQHLYMAVVTVGQLAYLILGHVLDTPYYFALPETLDRNWIQVWPPTRELVSWPPPQAVGEQDVRAVLDLAGRPMGGVGGTLMRHRD
jgi:hypothetical protein